MLIGIVLIVLVLAAAAVFVIARWQRMNLRKNFRLEIRNLGNVPSPFELRAEDPDHILAFEFRSAGVSLSSSTVAQTGQAPELIAPSQQGTGAAEGKQAPPRGKASDAKQVQQKAQKAMGASKAIADLLGSIGMMLPRSIGAPLLDVSAQFRRGQGKVDQVQRLPQRVSGQATKVKTLSGAIPGVPSGSAQAQRSASAPTSEAEPAPEAGPAAVPVTELVETRWLQTPVVEPGESIRLDLQIRPTRARSDHLCSFSILTRSMEQEDSAVVTDEWSGEIGGVGGLRRYHPYVLIASIAIFVIGLAFWLAGLGVLS